MRGGYGGAKRGVKRAGSRGRSLRRRRLHDRLTRAPTATPVGPLGVAAQVGVSAKAEPVSLKPKGRPAGAGCVERTCKRAASAGFKRASKGSIRRGWLALWPAESAARRQRVPIRPPWGGSVGEKT